jgi:hypothetical protein
VLSLWLKLSLAYALKHDNVLVLCRKLYNALISRDNYLEREFNSDIDELRHNEHKIINIKCMCIATTILEITRKVDKKSKNYIKDYCDAVLYEKLMLDH